MRKLLLMKDSRACALRHTQTSDQRETNIQDSEHE